MNQDLTSNESLIARIQQLENERDALQNDIEQLCIQQAGPAYLGVATRLHFQRMAGLEQEIENVQMKLTVCTRENKNLQEELSEAYRIKSQLADLHSAEVLKNMEAEKQLKFFQACVAAAFAERDNAIMEAEKAKEKEELIPQELNKSERRIEELTSELLQEKKLVKNLRIDLEKKGSQHEVFKEVINKFYNIRESSLENVVDANLEDKCECLLNDPEEMWRFENDEETSTSSYISSLEAEIDTLRKGLENLQNKLQVGLEIESHLKKKFRDLEKTNILSEEMMKKQISALLGFHSQFRISITNLLDQWHTELKSVIDVMAEKVRELQLSGQQNLKSSPEEDVESGSECKDVHVSADSNTSSIAKIVDQCLTVPNITRNDTTSKALAQALQEKVEALLLLSQQDERQLLERNVNAALQKKNEELQRNLLQVTNEKVKALMELAQLKQERFALQEKIGLDIIQGKQLSESGEQRILHVKDGRLKNFLKGSYLRRWVGNPEGNDTEAPLSYETLNSQMDLARMKIENATFKESLESMEHLLSSIRRLRISLLKVKDSIAAKTDNTTSYENLNKIIAEMRLVKIALGSSLPVSWSVEMDGTHQRDEAGSNTCFEKTDFVTAAGFEMVDVLVFAADVLKEQISPKVGQEYDSDIC